MIWGLEPQPEGAGRDRGKDFVVTIKGHGPKIVDVKGTGNPSQLRVKESDLVKKDTDLYVLCRVTDIECEVLKWQHKSVMQRQPLEQSKYLNAPMRCQAAESCRHIDELWELTH